VQTLGVITVLLVALVLGSVMVTVLTSSNSIVIDRTFSGGDVLSLDLPSSIDSLRVTGTVTGSADIYVQSGNERTLIAHVEDEQFADACDNCDLDLSSPDVQLVVEVDGELYLDRLSTETSEPEEESIAPSFTGLTFGEFGVAANTTPPNITELALYSPDGSNKSNRDIQFLPQNFSPGDDEFVEYIYSYKLNGTPLEAIIVDFSGNTVSSNATANGSAHDFSGNNVSITIINGTYITEPDRTALTNNTFPNITSGNYTHNQTIIGPNGNWTVVVENVSANFSFGSSAALNESGVRFEGGQMFMDIQPNQAVAILTENLNHTLGVLSLPVDAIPRDADAALICVVNDTITSNIRLVMGSTT
jgi:hypothetical protein